VADETQVIDRLPLLGEVERRQLLYEWNETVVEYPREKCIHELFEEQVEKTPEAGSGSLRRRTAHLPGVELSGQSAGALSEGAGCEAG